MKKLALLLGIFATSAALATHPTGMDDALRICQELSFDSNKATCMNILSQVEFVDDLIPAVCKKASFDSSKIDCLKNNANALFSAPALELCTSLSFDSNKTACMSKIHNKDIYPAGLAICKSMSFDSTKISCIETAPFRELTYRRGRQMCSERNYMNKVRGALGNLEGGNSQATRRTLIGLLETLEHCSK